MTDRTTQRELDRFRVLLDMIAENGATGPGSLPPAEHIEALRSVDRLDRDRMSEIREAHANGKAPPQAQA